MPKLEADNTADDQVEQRSLCYRHWRSNESILESPDSIDQRLEMSDEIPAFQTLNLTTS